MSSTSFERYAPFIQEYIYRKGWQELREVQNEACSVILDENCHLIIASGTASGKTEAAFFPVLTELYAHPAQSIGVLYISPLKALINDQFARLSELLEDSGIPVWSWHGDVAQSRKLKAIRYPRGIMQITPESLESLLRKPELVQKLFGDLRFVIIDEIHSLMGQDRGLQVLCLLTRLERLCEVRPRRIGMSATLNDYEAALRFLSAGSSLPARAVGMPKLEQPIGLFVEGYQLPKAALNPALEDERREKEEQSLSLIYTLCRKYKCLIFANSRASCERIIHRLKERALRLKEPDIFYVHHGSLSAAMRQSAEQALKQSSGPIAAAATLTLELGIDIGDLDVIIQLDAPFSCSSFVQRLGRSGRRSGRSQMVFITHDNYDETSSDPLYALPWKLLNSIAVIELYHHEKWVEPFSLKPKPYSLLAHQTLSTLLCCSSLTPRQLAGRVLTLPPFAGTVSADEYRRLLRYMLEQEYLERLDDNEIFVGLKAERYTSWYTFFAVFKEDKEIKVRSEEEGELGTLDDFPEPGQLFMLGGRSWKTVEVNRFKNLVEVEPWKSGDVPAWQGKAGSLHGRIVQQMRSVLTDREIYRYLQPQAVECLEKARGVYEKYGLGSAELFEHGEFLYLCPWCGTKELNTIERLLNNGLSALLRVKAVINCLFYLKIVSRLTAADFAAVCRTMTLKYADPDLALSKSEPRENFEVDRYDFMVPEDLLRQAYCLNCLDVPAALEILRNLRTVEDAAAAKDAPQTENASADADKGDAEAAAADAEEDGDDLSPDPAVISCSEMPQ